MARTCTVRAGHSEGDEGSRLDVFLARALAGDIPSRAFARKLIDQGNVLVNGSAAKPSYRVRAGDLVEAVIPEPEQPQCQPEDIPLDILYEDADIIVVNKPRGMVVHPAAGNPTHTLVNALLAHCRDLSGIGGEMRPGIVHRLDKDTSGVMVAAKNDLAHASLAAQLKAHEMEKTYLALVHGEVREARGSIRTHIGRHPVHRKKMAVVEEGRGKLAITHFEVLERFEVPERPGISGRFTLLKVVLETGRTHQIRVHMASIGHPIVCDNVYGRRRCEFDMAGQALHAWKLKFRHPRTGEVMGFCAPVPDDMQGVISSLRARSLRGDRDDMP
ncbi:MAG TPA: RluA family pseudouridine synthase [Firmicutes bacterium]|nr:RluA family pseudouridine synthase [Bacillota bacterium]